MIDLDRLCRAEWGHEGYASAHGKDLIRQALCSEAIDLTRVLRGLLLSGLNVESPEVDSLLALMLLHDARRHSPSRRRND